VVKNVKSHAGDRVTTLDASTTTARYAYRERRER
jgi:hypothetical protein